MLGAGIVLAVSCRKPQPYETIQKKVSGTWRVTQTATDANANGMIDPGETTPDTTGTTLVLNTDGTGSTSYSLLGYSLPVSLTWELTDNNTNIKETLTIPVVNTTTVINAHIEELTSTNMTVSSKLATVTTWTYYQKM